MCLRAEGIDENNGGVGRGRRAKGLRDDDTRGIRDASKGLETTTDAAGDRRLDREIYDDGGGVGGGRRARIIQQKTTDASAEDRQRV